MGKKKDEVRKKMDKKTYHRFYIDDKIQEKIEPRLTRQQGQNIASVFVRYIYMLF